MGRRRNDNAPINENWVRLETKLDYHNQAVRTLESAKRHEAEHKHKTIRIDRRTIILKRID